MNAAFRLSSIVLLLLSLHASGDDWPQWRGPQRDGTWAETGIITSFPKEGLKPKWSAPVGAGYSSPTIAGSQVFLTDRITTPEEQERVHCWDAATGKPLWTHAYACDYQDFGYPLGPRAAVSVADGRAFALGSMGHFHCLDTATGKVLWSRDLAAEYRADMPIWGISASPLVVGDHVIIQIGGPADACVVALDVASGKEKWRALDGKASYSAPRLIKHEGRDVVLAWTGDWLAALDPATGTAVWKQPYRKNKMVINVPDAILDETGKRLFLSAFYDGSRLFNLTPSGPELAWERQGVSERRTDALHCMISTPFIRGEHVYGIDSYGELRCLNLATGDRVWSDESLLANGRWATAYLVQNGEHTWISTETGELIIAKVSPEGFQRLSSTQLIKPTTNLRGRNHLIDWSHPAYAHQCIFWRNDETLICVSLAAGK